MSNNNDTKINRLYNRALNEDSLKSFMGNKLLKKAGEVMTLTQDHKEEFKKCHEDPIYFIERYVKIISIDKGLHTIKLYDYQKEIIKKFKENRFNILLQCRQSGKTVVYLCFLLWYILFNSDKRIGVLANKGATARMIVGRIQLAYMYLPKWLQQGVTEWNKGSFALENKSSLISASTSSDNVRGDSFSMIILDEMAFIPPNVFDEFWESVYPTISSGKDSKMILVSTFKGQNHFYDKWMDAIAGKNSYVPSRVDWWDVPGRDEAWKEETIRNIGLEKFAQEYGNEALGTGNTLIDARGFNILYENLMDPIQSTVDLKIFKYPEKNHRYMISCDCADLGTDYSAFSVIDITKFPYEQVATFKSQSISHLQYPSIILELGLKYNTATVLVENNAVGQTVLHILNYEYEYDDIVSTRTSVGNKIKLGLTQTTKTKAVGCARLKDMISTRNLIIRDKYNVEELKYFGISGSSYKGLDGSHDDATMALVTFAYYASTPSFLNRFDENFVSNTLETYEQEILESLTPLPMFSKAEPDVLEGLPPGFLD